MKFKKNAFTLIELLAVIVILAIIAVIVVPKITAQVEESKKNVAKTSALNYKKGVSEYIYYQDMEGNDLDLDGTYNINENGYLYSGNNVIEASFNGQKPKNGYLIYDKNELSSGCLTINKYKVTFTNGEVSNIEKGECAPSVPTMAEMCPGCKFIFTTSTLTIGTSDMPSSATDDYTDWTSGENSHPYFLGLIESTTSSGKIGRAFACGVENDTPFCLEGFDTSKWSDDYNVGVLNTIFPSCNASASDSDAGCGDGSGVYAYAYDIDNVGVSDGNGYCSVLSDGIVHCTE